MSKEYDEYLNRHMAGVRAAASMLITHNLVARDKILSLVHRAECHDKSKYREIEYGPYNAYFYNVGTEGMSREEIEEQFDRAFLEHMHVNDHHWQHWILPYDDSAKTKAIEMPEDAVYEMMCDWWSFSLVNKNPSSIFEWYASHKEIMILNPNTLELVVNLMNGIQNIIEFTTNEEWQELYDQIEKETEDGGRQEVR